MSRRCFSPSSIFNHTLIGKMPSPTSASPQPKKECLCRGNPAHPGDEVEGSGPRPRYSFGKHMCFGLASGGRPDRRADREVRLARRSRQRPRSRTRRFIPGLVYDRDQLQKRLKAKKVEWIFPHQRNRKKTTSQDGRKLRAYWRKRKIESFGGLEILTLFRVYVMATDH